MNIFTNTDALNKPQKLHIRWEMETPRDDAADAPDKMDEGFWPSLDREAAGWIGDNPEKPFHMQRAGANARMEAWRNDDWQYIGVVAVAHLSIPIGGGSFRLMTLRSAGLWGIESDAGDYLKEVFEEEKDGLLFEIKTMGAALVSGDFVAE